MTDRRKGRIVNLEKMTGPIAQRIIDELSLDSALRLVGEQHKLVRLLKGQTGTNPVGQKTAAEIILKLGLLLVEDKQRNG